MWSRVSAMASFSNTEVQLRGAAELSIYIRKISGM